MEKKQIPGVLGKNNIANYIFISFIHVNVRNTIIKMQKGKNIMPRNITLFIRKIRETMGYRCYEVII